jgi:hypothetical protein
MAKKFIIVVLHGGLGNQLFQYLLAKILMVKHPQYEIKMIDDLLSKYNVVRNFELSTILNGSEVQSYRADWLIRLRLPKIMGRLSRTKESVVRIPYYGYIVDGYYQSVDSYLAFSDYSIASAIESIRAAVYEKNILTQPLKNKVRHLRLTDFFESDQEARVYIRKCLAEVDSDLDFVTDQEDLLLDELKHFKSHFEVNLIPTSHMHAWDLVTLISSYKQIVTNGSTLPMWAAILARTELTTSNKNHFALWSKLVRL